MLASFMLAHWIMLIGALLPYAIVLTAKATAQYDNADPRNARNFVGWRARAHAAHGNALEAFAPFAVAVLLATVRGANPSFVSIAAVVWLVARLLHWYCYVTDRPSARSIVWFVGIFAVLAIFLAALLA